MKSKLNAESNYDVLEISGEVDLHYSPELREMILASIKDGKSLLIDMENISYIDSSGIASLVEGFQVAKKGNLEFGLLNISDPAKQVLTLTRLDRVFTLYVSIDQFQSQLQG